MRIRSAGAALAVFAAAGLSGCGGGGGGGGPGAAPPTYTVGGTAAGLSGAGLVLQLNGGGNLAVSADGTFTFTAQLGSGATYAASVLAQPTNPTQTCAVSTGSGTVVNANVTNVSVSCTTDTFTIGGTVSGLSGAGLVLRNNTGNDLAIGANGAFNFSVPILSGAGYAVTVLTQPSAPSQTCTVLSASGTVVNANVTNVSVSCVTNTFTIGGTVSGLSGAGLVLRNNTGNDLAIGANGAFNFSVPILSGAGYAVTVFTQPSAPSQTCTVLSGSGTVVNANVTNVSVSCTTITFTIGGTVSGLSGTGLVLQNNAGNNLAISTNGGFTFSTPIASGATYAVTVLTQPTGPSQTCAVTSGAGTVGAGNVINVSVSCATNTFTIGGTVSGHNGTGLTLRLNGTTNLAVAGNGAFAFGAIVDGSAYVVTVFVQPIGQTCAVTGGSGTLAGASVTTITVSCTGPFTLGGTVSGLAGSGLVLQNNGGNNLAVGADGSFTFGASLAPGAVYAVTVFTQPSAPSQTCTVLSGSGTVVNANVTNVSVSCTTDTFTIGGTVSGLSGTGLVLQNNFGNNFAVSNNATSFAFTTPIASGANYAVTVLTQPANPTQTCTVTGGSGTVVSTNVTNVSISCTTNSFTVGGTVSGSNNLGFTLRLNGTTNLIGLVNGAFAFPAMVDGSSYSVAVFVQPLNQTCTVANGNGALAGANVTNIAVSCTTDTHTIGGTVSGLSGTGLVLKNNGGNNLSITGNDTFTFGTPIDAGSTYNVSVLTQPTAPTQTCTVSSGSGTVGSANVTTVSVTCSTNTYTIGGTITGLSGTGLVLRNNGGDNLTVLANATDFTFSTAIASGATYAVTVLTQPTTPSQTCAVTSDSGTVGSANVTNVSVSCTTNSFTIGGIVSALVGTGLVLQNNAGNNLAIAVNGGFTFTAPVLSGAPYAVTVLTQPTGPAQTCTVSNGSGTVGAGNVTNVKVGCGFSIGTVSDPLAAQQWHLKNTGQNGFADGVGVAGMDINVDPVYSTFGFTGDGVIVAVVDTGLEIAHEDLAANVVAGGSWNFINSTTNPTSTAIDGDHGTSVSGLIAMARNTVGGIGVAPGVRLKGFNFLSSDQMGTKFVDSLGASSANPNSSNVFIFNQSFGIDTTNDILIDPVEEAQYFFGVTSLRGSKGALYVKAAGNGFSNIGNPPIVANCVGAIASGVSCDNANFDPANTLPYQIVVGAANADGIKASYSSTGSAIWVSAPGGEFGFNASVDPGFVAEAYEPAMVTTDQTGPGAGYAASGFGFSAFDNCGAPNTSCNYTNGMNGTSSATPVTAGVIALMLEANPALTWRDVKHILASTARQIDAARAAVNIVLGDGSYIAEPAWTTNHATPQSFKFHNWYGFGLVDASAAVNMARTYTPGQLGAFSNTGLISSAVLSIAIPDNSVTGATSTLTVPSGPPVQVIEAVQISVTATHTFTGDLGIELTSPLGTRSVLKNIRDGFGASANLNGMVLLSNAFYGENPAGVWSIKVVDGSGVNATAGTLVGWTIRIHGH